jgi:histidine ammonia-lyase
MNDNLNVILGVEAISAAQGIEFRAPLATSAPLQEVIRRLRAEVPRIVEDRYLAPNIEAAARMVIEGSFTRDMDLAAEITGQGA